MTAAIAPDGAAHNFRLASAINDGVAFNSRAQDVHRRAQAAVGRDGQQRRLPASQGRRSAALPARAGVRALRESQPHARAAARPPVLRAAAAILAAPHRRHADANGAAAAFVEPFADLRDRHRRPRDHAGPGRGTRPGVLTDVRNRDLSDYTASCRPAPTLRDDRIAPATRSRSRPVAVAGDRALRRYRRGGRRHVFVRRRRSTRSPGSSTRAPARSGAGAVRSPRTAARTATLTRPETTCSRGRACSFRDC